MSPAVPPSPTNANTLAHTAIVCGICGAVLHHTVSTHADGRTFHRYACTAAAHLSRTQPELDAYVEAIVLAYLRDDTKLAAILAEGENVVDADELRTRRTALVAQKDELATLFTDGVLDAPGVRRESAKLTRKIAGIDTALAEAARRNPVADLVKDGPELVETRWAALSPDLKGKIVDELCTVSVNPSPRGRYFRPECIDIKPKVSTLMAARARRFREAHRPGSVDAVIKLRCNDIGHARGKVAKIETFVRVDGLAPVAAHRRRDQAPTRSWCAGTDTGHVARLPATGRERPRNYTCKLCGLSFAGADATLTRILDLLADQGVAQINLKALSMIALESFKRLVARAQRDRASQRRVNDPAREAFPCRRSTRNKPGRRPVRCMRGQSKNTASTHRRRLRRSPTSRLADSPTMLKMFSPRRRRCRTSAASG